jgi:predicted double-glycine peptidase
MNGLKMIFIWLSFSFLSGCINTDLPKPNYEFGDKSSLNAIRWGGLVKQDLDFSCGIASVATILKYHFGEEDVTERELLQDFIKKLSEQELNEVFEKGASLAQLGDLLLDRNLIIRNWRLEIDELRKLTKVLPAIVYLETPDFRHFAVVRGVSDYQVLLADPSRGNVKLSLGEFLKESQGRRALLVALNQQHLKKALLQTPDPKDSDARAEIIRSIITQKR